MTVQNKESFDIKKKIFNWTSVKYERSISIYKRYETQTEKNEWLVYIYEQKHAMFRKKSENKEKIIKTHKTIGFAEGLRE